MKSVQLIGYGDAVENLEMRDIPEPAAPGPGEALVGVEYAPINFNDLMVPWGIYLWKPELPATIGNEGSGIVLAVGAGVSSVKPGERVVLPPTAKSFQQRLLVPADQLVVVPSDADPKQVSMMAINPVTAALLLSEYVDLKPGDAISLNSATSGLSQWLFALAKKKGLKTVGLVRRAEDVEIVKSRGCDYVIVDDEDMVVAKERLKDLNIRLALDVLGGPAAGRLLQTLSPKGKLVVYGAVTLKPMEISAGVMIAGDLTIESFFEYSERMAPKVIPTLRQLTGLISGPDAIVQPIAATYPIDQIKEAVAHAIQGKKVILDIGGAAQA
ncbi:zinc-dependent alcohol dehydrogenase family protein [Pseudomonas sp. H11T01]|uniref:zinc-dependent alcohol dehydrogenase family protein n=1 Tax=Pseudomonas sp. H11T01 TaxID=3402749 RepID=UPI003ACBDAAB